ncbi:hypothetical protein H5410_021590 [Solanum commersonii]|uniref:Uncharacterized protein n=1 Tax=Solanum commersonii TaxID=4109 RepID=A0A9J5ZD06_SOLCO|nr:hypothetical protein H5410_021590 [Solanum commersonii]
MLDRVKLSPVWSTIIFSPPVESRVINEKHHIMLDQASMESTLLMQVQATQGRVLLLNPSYHDMVWTHQVKLPCRALYCA